MYEYIMGGVALLSCVYASFTDIRYGKVKNLCTYSLIYMGAVSHILQWVLGQESITYLIALFIGSGLIAYAWYYFGIMGAGDAKLFWGLCLIIPSSLFKDINGDSLFPPVVFTINAFGLYFLGVAVYILLKSTFAQKLQALRSSFQIKDIPRSVIDILSFLAFSSLTSTALVKLSIIIGLRLGLSIRLGHFARIVLPLCLYFLYRKGIQKIHLDRYHFYVLCAIYFVFLQFSSPSWVIIATKALLRMLGVYMIVFAFYKSFIFQLGNSFFGQDVGIQDLKAGMIPFDYIIQTVDVNGNMTYTKIAPSFHINSKSQVVITPTLRGLSEENISLLKSLAQDGHFHASGEKLRIQKPLRFAPVLLIGTVITIIFHGPFYSNPLLSSLL